MAQCKSYDARLCGGISCCIFCLGAKGGCQVWWAPRRHLAHVCVGHSWKHAGGMLEPAWSPPLCDSPQNQPRRAHFHKVSTGAILKTHTLKRMGIFFWIFIFLFFPLPHGPPSPPSLPFSLPPCDPTPRNHQDKNIFTK